MATILTKIVHNCETGITEEIPLNAEELAQLEIDRLAWQAEQSAQATAEAERAALKASAIAKLTTGKPLTADEAALLVV